MPSIKPSLDRLTPVLRRAVSRVRGRHAALLAVVAAAAFGVAGLRAIELPSPRPISDSDRLHIEVVHPVEPEITPGSLMDVGELVNGFQGVPPPPPSLTDVAWSPEDDPYAYEAAGAPARRDPHRAEGRLYESRPEPERPSPVRAVQRWFGFDAPREDFRAQREARRARMEAMERDAREHRARERHASERYRRERAEDERYASERRRWEQARDDRYVVDDRRRGDREAPRWRDDRAYAGEVDRGPAWAPPEAAFDYVSPPPHGPRPYFDAGR